ncbi:MAG: hypothetical protein ACOZE7_04295 [Pseudomonadota bacterium]
MSLVAGTALWVLLVVPSETKSGMMAQSFQTLQACEAAKAWVMEQKRGNDFGGRTVFYATATCIEDPPPKVVPMGATSKHQRK